jgi:trk system potassium uptake protein TrkA
MKFCVIGLGRFGFQVATGLAENGMEVLAIDSDETIVASIRDHVTQAICMRVSDEASLVKVGVEEMDVAIVAMGENFDQSILITALLKKRLHIEHVIARAISPIHQEILHLIGADQVILPEQEVGRRLADNLSTLFTEVVRISNDFSISQITAPKKFVGSTIKKLDLYKKYHAYCIGLKQDDQVLTIDPDYLIHEHDILIFAGKNKALEAIARL